MRTRRAAVLGAGIMGCSLALLLARQGARVTLIDMADAPFAGPSRWNEGKIHLGFLYSADPSLATARRLIPGGLAFRRLTEELTGCSLEGEITREDDVYLVHRDSVVGAAAMGAYFERVAELVQSHPDAARYLVDASDGRVRRLSPRELAGLAHPDTVVAGYAVPERSVRTTWLADRFVEAVGAEPRIELALSTRVSGVDPVSPDEGTWALRTDPPLEPRYDLVVNALWHGRPAIDRAAGFPVDADCSHRYRLSVFGRVPREVELPSVVLAAGPFGDIKNYNGRDFYCSWYPVGLIAEGESPDPPELPPLDGPRRREVADATMEALGRLVPGARDLAAGAEALDVEGGWVFARGRGSLADPRSGLHRRDRFGARAPGSYISVDTGKYSTAPWLARELVDRIMPAR